MSKISTSRLFFVVSGEHIKLPQAEIKAILISESIPFEEVYSGFKLLIIDAPILALDAISRRSLMLECCGIVIVETFPKKEEIIRALRASNISKMFGYKNLMSYSNSSAKKRIEEGLIKFYNAFLKTKQ